MPEPQSLALLNYYQHLVEEETRARDLPPTRRNQQQVVADVFAALGNGAGRESLGPRLQTLWDIMIGGGPIDIPEDTPIHLAPRMAPIQGRT